MRKTALIAAASASFLLAPLAIAQETAPEAPAPTEEPAPAPSEEPTAEPADEPAPSEDAAPEAN